MTAEFQLFSISLQQRVFQMIKRRQKGVLKMQTAGMQSMFVTDDQQQVEDDSRVIPSHLLTTQPGDKNFDHQQSNV